MVYLNLSGNVGIETTSPQWKLHLNSSDETVALIESNGANSYPNLRIKNDAQTWYLYNDGSQSGASADMFGIHNGTAYRLAILTNGNVGIWTTSPQSLLHVNSSTSNAYIQFPVNSTALAAADCDSEAERGRMIVDPSGDNLFICSGASGWRKLTTAAA